MYPESKQGVEAPGVSPKLHSSLPQAAPMNPPTSEVATMESKGGMKAGSSQSLTEFTCFPELPPELRLRVWKIHLDTGGRFVELKYGIRPFQGIMVYEWRSDTKIPTILHINQETRHEGLKVYKAAFNRNYSNSTYQSPRITYFNPAIDTIYLDWPTMNMFAKYVGLKELPTDISTAPSLAIDAMLIQFRTRPDPSDLVRDGNLCLEIFKDVFGGLKKLYIVHEMDLLSHRRPKFLLSSAGDPDDNIQIKILREEVQECWDMYCDSNDSAANDIGVTEREEERQGDAYYPLPIVKSIKRYRAQHATKGKDKKDGWFEVESEDGNEGDHGGKDKIGTMSQNEDEDGEVVGRTGNES